MRDPTVVSKCLLRSDETRATYLNVWGNKSLTRHWADQNMKSLTDLLAYTQQITHPLIMWVDNV